MCIAGQEVTSDKRGKDIVPTEGVLHRGSSEKVYYYHHHHKGTNDSHYNHHLAVFPPVFAFEFCSAALELRGPVPQSVSPVIQLRELCVSLQYFLQIYLKDTLDLLYLCLCLLQSPVTGQVGRARWGA